MTGKPRIPREPAALPAYADMDAPENRDQAKVLLRRQLLATRAALAPQQRAAWDAAIGDHLLDWWRGARPAVLGVYQALRGEPDLSAAYDALAQLGARLALPVVVARAAPLGFAEWVPGEALGRDQMGVAVPREVRAIECPPALLVPCLGFNADHFRLGYGGGYYDRTLAMTPRAQTLGIAYACLQADFASAPHDVALDAIVTEQSMAPMASVASMASSLGRGRD